MFSLCSNSAHVMYAVPCPTFMAHTSMYIYMCVYKIISHQLKLVHPLIVSCSLCSLTNKCTCLDFPSWSHVHRTVSELLPLFHPLRGDHTTAGCNLFVVPPHIEAVVFSIDGALTSNFSISAKDIKLKPGAVEVAR